MSDKLKAALEWWYSDDCSRLPTVVHAAEHVIKTWGAETLEAMKAVFIQNLRDTARQEAVSNVS